jgi:hypothetical protein
MDSGCYKDRNSGFTIYKGALVIALVDFSVGRFEVKRGRKGVVREIRGKEARIDEIVELTGRTGGVLNLLPNDRIFSPTPAATDFVPCHTFVTQHYTPQL